jgi:hypothetical protein
MKPKRCIEDVLQEQVGIDAAKIHKKVRTMIKAGASTEDIESAVAKHLSVHFKSQLKCVLIKHG